MDAYEENILQRWQYIALKDFGPDRNAEAQEILEVFKEVFENENTCIKIPTYLISVIREFIYGNTDIENECNIFEKLNFNYINITKYAANRLEKWLWLDKEWGERFVDACFKESDKEKLRDMDVIIDRGIKETSGIEGSQEPFSRILEGKRYFE